MGARGQHVLVIRVTSVLTSVRSINAPPKGVREGEIIFLTDQLLNVMPQFGRPARASVGSDQGTLTVVSATTARLVGTASFPDGTIKLNGLIPLAGNRPTVIPVVGGTGRYAGARGADTQPAPGGNTELNTYRLTLP